MATSPTSFGGVMLGTSATVIGTANSRTKWVIQKLTLHNTGSAAATLKVWLVPQDETPTDQYLIAEETLSVDETWSCPGIERLVALPGTTIQGASTPGTINAVGSALEVT